jgi:ABC-type multidrug transport system fused ATPase/permease subunit
VLGITAIQIIQSFAFAHFLYRSQLMGGLVRAILISATFEKSLKLSGKARSGTNAVPSYSEKTATDAVRGWPNGRIMSMISTDISRIDQACGTFHYIWTSVIAIILTVGLLIFNLGVSALAGVGFLIAGLAFVTTIVKRVGSKRSAINKITDKRVGLTAEVLESIKFVKLFAWETAFAEKLKHLRLSETSALYSLHVMKSAIGSLSMALPIFANMLTFITYSLTGNQFEPAEVFSSLALLNSLRNPLNWVPVALGQAVEAWSAFGRIEGFLLADELPEEFQIAEKQEHALVLQDASFTWEQPVKSDEGYEKGPKPAATQRMRNLISGGKSKVKTEAESQSSSRSDSTVVSESSARIFQLRNLNIAIGKEELIAVIGPVGSGKSSFVNALAGEMRQTSGTLSFNQNQALSPQSAWVQNATIRDNILFGVQYDHDRYWKIIDACALGPDLDLLDDGDMTEIGERGVTLSGGQKQRINIARAIYADAGIIVMDDPLSALDAQVGAHVFREAIKGFLAGRCRILVTHATHVLPQCDRVIVLRDGSVSAIGTYEELLASKSGLRQMLESTSTRNDDAGKKPATRAGPAVKTETIKSKTNLMQADTKANREVSWTVYFAWLRASGSLSNGLTIVLLCTLFRAANVLTSLWLSWWTSDQFNLPRNTYVCYQSWTNESQANSKHADCHLCRARHYSRCSTLHLLHVHLLHGHTCQQWHVTRRHVECPPCSNVLLRHDAPGPHHSSIF